MIKKKNLLSGIGNYDQTNKYYNDWSNTYDQTLLRWDYRAPKNSSKILKSYLQYKPKNLLDLACGTGLFAERMIRMFPSTIIDGVDISKKILAEARKKNIYRHLIYCNFDNEFKFKEKYDLISCIGALTYTKNPYKLFCNIYKNTSKNGHFIFTQRLDLWKKQNYTSLIEDLSSSWKKIFISKPMLYLPNNSDFANKIKIKITLLKKKN